MDFYSFRQVPNTGVIYVMTEATRKGYSPGATDWVNFGQGQPEAGEVEGAPKRVSHLSLGPDDLEYAPVPGLWELRDAIAQYYNHYFRRGMKSQFSAENVAVAPGGRAALTRVVATLGNVNLGHFLPDYTAYEELLGLFRGFIPIPILLDQAKGYEFNAEDLTKEVTGRGLGAVLLSNPCNPTGKVIAGEGLNQWIGAARRLNFSVILDEFYSHYLWVSSGHSPMESSARYIEDVEREPVVIIDGLTKNWRYPGWRVAWTIAPKAVTRVIASAGSFLDGGSPRPLQKASLPLMNPDHIDQETAAIQSCFAKKRKLLLDGLKECGIKVDVEPQGAFYIWARIDDLPEPINTGMSFFQKALEHKLIVVPGEFFDVDPGGRRALRASRFKNHLRFSFGAPEGKLIEGIKKLKSFIRG